jgi:hypothetical protein
MERALVIVSKTLNKKTLKYYSEILSQEPIYFVSPVYDSYLDNFKNVIYKEDSFFLKRDNFPIIEKTVRPNWYYQQFLKYQIVINLDYDIVHIVDGDSFVKKDLIFSENILYSSKKIEDNYYDFINLLFNKKENFSKRNYITNQMCFKREYLIELVNQITQSNENWIVYLCSLLLDNNMLWFSEYQTYADYVLNNKFVKEKPIKVFRRFDFINKALHNAFKYYDILAEEPQHNNDILRKIRAKLFYILKQNLG